MKLLITFTACFALLAGAVTGFAEETVQESEAESSEAAEIQPGIQPDPAIEDEEPAAGSGETQEAVDEIYIMDVPLDGSSVESFMAGLEAVDENATEQEYRNLMSALDFLLFYDVGVRRDKARLYTRLNGKTPNQIIQRVADTRSGSNN